MNFATTHFVPRSYFKISCTAVFVIPDQLPVLTLSVTDLCWLQPVHVQHSQAFCLLQTFQNMDHFQQILDHLWGNCAILFSILVYSMTVVPIFSPLTSSIPPQPHSHSPFPPHCPCPWVIHMCSLTAPFHFLPPLPLSLPYFYLNCTHCIIPKSLLNHPNSFCRGMFKLNIKFDAYLLLYLLSHFECDGHSVHMLPQWRLQPPLTSTAESSSFTLVHSSPLSLASTSCKPFSLY